MRLSICPVVLIASCLVVVVSGCPEPSTRGSTERISQQESRATLTAADLREQKRNFEGSVVTLTGKFQKFDPGPALADGPWIFVGDDLDSAIPCYFARGADEELESLKIGEQIAIKGKVKTAIILCLKSCSLQAPGENSTSSGTTMRE